MNKLPIEFITSPMQFDEFITDETNTYVAKMGHDVVFNKNEPYKFEELKPNMWVWNNRSKKYLKVEKTVVIEGVEKIMSSDIWTKFYVAFEPNCFYPREVK